MEIKTNVNLDQYTSWLLGGPADYFALPTTIDELKEAWTWALEKALPVTWFGGGSNLLLSDKGVRGLVICLQKLSKIEISIEGSVLVIKCLAGTPKSELLKTFL